MDDFNSRMNQSMEGSKNRTKSSKLSYKTHPNISIKKTLQQ